MRDPPYGRSLSIWAVLYPGSRATAITFDLSPGERRGGVAPLPGCNDAVIVTENIGGKNETTSLWPFSLQTDRRPAEASLAERQAPGLLGDPEYRDLRARRAHAGGAGRIGRQDSRCPYLVDPRIWLP